jgi:hypothetical protein
MDSIDSVRAGGGEAAPHGEGEIFDPKGHRPTGRALRWSAIGASLALLTLLLIGIVPRVLHRSAMEEDTRQAETDLARVRVARVTRSGANSALVLPGSVQPLQETPIYARAN